MGRSPDIEVIIIKLGIGCIAVCEYESIPYDLISVASESLHPSLLAVLAKFTDNLIDHIPGIYPAGISSGHGFYMSSHRLNQVFA